MKISRALAIALVALGFGILAVASVLPMLLPTSLFWTAEQAREQATAASRLHQVTHQAAHTQESKTASQADKLQAQQELEAAQARYDASRSDLDRAQFWRRTVPQTLRWIGGALALIGALTYLSTGPRND